jgi:hypothetical protein
VKKTVFILHHVQSAVAVLPFVLCCIVTVNQQSQQFYVETETAQANDSDNDNDNANVWVVQ